MMCFLLLSSFSKKFKPYNLVSKIFCRLGLIEWIDDICPLKGIIEEEKTSLEKRQFNRAFAEYSNRYPDNANQAYLLNYSSYSADKCSKWFAEIQSAIEADPLR